MICRMNQHKRLYVLVIATGSLSAFEYEQHIAFLCLLASLTRPKVVADSFVFENNIGKNIYAC